MFEIRLGDIIDDFCIKCRRLTNHAIVSIIDGAAAKVRCRTCYHDHDYRHEQAPPSKKDLKKAELEMLAAAAGAEGVTAVEGEAAAEADETEMMAANEDAVLAGGDAEAPAAEPVPAVEKKKGGRKAAKK